MIKRMVLGLAVWLLALPVQAGSPEVVGVEVKKRSSGRYTFRVSIRHTDQGWEHYVDRWEITLPDGTVLESRILPQPHLGESVFTRSLHGVELQKGISAVLVRAHDVRHGFGDKVMEVRIPR